MGFQYKIYKRVVVHRCSKIEGKLPEEGCVEENLFHFHITFLNHH